jgi:hypothetical protein
MVLSRHFYSSDEVQAALLYTTTRSIPDEALFWCQEMLLSGYHSETISILFQSWLWHTGSLRLQWLINAYKSLAKDEISEDEILLATYQLSTISQTNRDTSLWNILVLTAKNNDMPDRITRKMPPLLPSDDKKEIYFISSIYQGKVRSAWWISRYLPTDRVWILVEWYILNIKSQFQQEYLVCLEAFINYDKLLGYKSDGYDVITRCMAILMLCNNKEQQEKSFKPLVSEIDSDNLQALNEWNVSVGRKERRIYQIPTSCLYGVTLRGRMKWSQNNLTQLYDIEKHLVGCMFWDEVISEYADISDPKNIVWYSDDKMEEFYDKYFPQDICDEWSKKDQQKSHGDGVLSPTDKPNINKYSRNYLSRNPYFAWNTTKDVNNYLEKIDISDCSLERIIEYYSAPQELTAEDLKKLEPVHKIKII